MGAKDEVVRSIQDLLAFPSSISSESFVDVSSTTLQVNNAKRQIESIEACDEFEDPWNSNWWWLQSREWKRCSWWRWRANIWQSMEAQATSAVEFSRQATRRPQVRAKYWYQVWPSHQPPRVDKIQERKGTKWAPSEESNWQCRREFCVGWLYRMWCQFQ